MTTQSGAEKVICALNDMQGAGIGGNIRIEFPNHDVMRKVVFHIAGMNTISYTVAFSALTVHIEFGTNSRAIPVVGGLE